MPDALKSLRHRFRQQFTARPFDRRHHNVTESDDIVKRAPPLEPLRPGLRGRARGVRGYDSILFARVFYASSLRAPLARSYTNRITTLAFARGDSPGCLRRHPARISLARVDLLA